MNGDIVHSDPEPPSLPRKITIERGAQGYGFNLHGEKGVHGQYISAVDEDSPAERNDLRVGDRVIAVNNEDVEDLAHSKVVERIRAGGNQVTLLVVDEQCDQYYKQLGLKIPQDKFETRYEAMYETPAEASALEHNNIIEENENREAEIPAVVNEAEQVETVPESSENVANEVVPAVAETANIEEKSEESENLNTDVTLPEAKPVEIPEVNREVPKETTLPEMSNVVSSTTGPSSNGPAETHSKLNLDMAAARPKPKRHEVKRATQNWKQKYDDFNKL